jgi:hypothetical protein
MGHFGAKVASGIEAVREWQRGSINWQECLRRVDVTAKGEGHLSGLTRTSSEDAVAQAVTAANAAGN